MDEQGNKDLLSILYKQLIGKMDTVIIGQSVMNARLSELESKVTALTETVRGSAGYSGLVADVEVIKNTLAKQPSCGDEKPDLLTFRWLREKLLVPVVLAMLLWLLLTFIPNTWAHMGSMP
jgi:hypothetical protein